MPTAYAHKSAKDAGNPDSLSELHLVDKLMTYPELLRDMNSSELRGEFGKVIAYATEGLDVVVDQDELRRRLRCNRARAVFAEMWERAA